MSADQNNHQTCSPEQLEANRANAEKSTGPRTDSGKQTASRNATRHALTGHRFTLRYDESEAEYQQVLNDLLREHRPMTTTEEIFVVRLAQSYWLTQRAIRIASSDENDHKQLALMMRYQALHDRAFQSALKQLIQLQKTRQAEEREEHLIAAAGKSFDLDAKCIRLDILRAKRDLAQYQASDARFRLAAQNEIAGLTAGLSLADEDEPEQPLAA